MTQPNYFSHQHPKTLKGQALLEAVQRGESDWPRRVNLNDCGLSEWLNILKS